MDEKAHATDQLLQAATTGVPTVKQLIRHSSVLLAMAVVAVTTQAEQVFNSRTVWTQEVADLGFDVAIETFNDAITNGVSITFANGIESAGQGGTTDNLVTGGAYNGRVDSDDDSSNDVFTSITWDLPTPTQAFAADFASTDSAERLLVRVTLDGVNEQTFDVAATMGGSSGFLGFVASQPFQRLTFVSDVTSTAIAPDEAFSVDNVSLPGQPLPIPEPHALATLSVMLLLTTGRQMRSRRGFRDAKRRFTRFSHH